MMSPIGRDPLGTWLDVGFGDGSLLAAAQEFGFRPFGLDLREEAVKRLAHQGIEAQLGQLHESPISDAAVISLADVLEHVPFPADLLASARQRLRFDGILFVSCPNMASVAWRTLTQLHVNPYWMELEHFHNFTRLRLTQLLEQCGFRIVQFGFSERYRLGMELIARVA